jgi:hypothetical protein
MSTPTSASPCGVRKLGLTRRGWDEGGGKNPVEVELAPPSSSSRPALPLGPAVSQLLAESMMMCP